MPWTEGGWEERTAELQGTDGAKPNFSPVWGPALAGPPFHFPAFVTVQNFKVAYKDFELLEVGRQGLKASPTLAAIVTTPAPCLALPTAITGTRWPALLPAQPQH